MPWQQRDIIQFCLILLCVPLQYYISGVFEGVKDSDRSAVLISIMKTVDGIKDNLFNFDLWTLKWHDLMIWIFSVEHMTESVEENDDSETVDVNAEKPSDDDYDDEGSEYDVLMRMSEIRTKRPIDLLYRVGQTVQLSNHAFRGIIVGWDYNEEVQSFVYSILLDESHMKSDMLLVLVEVEQDNLYVIKNHKIKHKYLERYFISYDGTQYLPKTWLKRLYPRD